MKVPIASSQFDQKVLKAVFCEDSRSVLSESPDG